VVERPERGPADPERDHRRRVVVDDGLDVRAAAVDLAVDEALEVERARVVDGAAVEVVLHDVARADQLRRQRSREQVALRLPRVAHAHVSVAVDHALVGQDPIGGDEVLDQTRVSDHGSLLCRAPGALAPRYTTATDARNRARAAPGRPRGALTGFRPPG
jgi:hypothetical protein